MPIARYWHSLRPCIAAAHRARSTRDILRQPPTDLYLFDGYNLLHAGGFANARELRDALASYVAVRGARGIVVFDGLGDLVSRGPLEVRYAPNADAILERLAAEHRGREHVVLVTSDATLKHASGIEVAKISSATFAGELRQAPRAEEPPRGLAGKLDEETRSRLERLRRGE